MKSCQPIGASSKSQNDELRMNFEREMRLIVLISAGKALLKVQELRNKAMPFDELVRGYFASQRAKTRSICVLKDSGPYNGAMPHLPEILGAM